MRESLFYFEHALGLSFNAELVRRLSRPVHRYDVTPQLRERLLKLESVDVLMYGEANTHLDQRLRDYGYERRGRDPEGGDRGGGGEWDEAGRPGEGGGGAGEGGADPEVAPPATASHDRDPDPAAHGEAGVALQRKKARARQWAMRHPPSQARA